MDKSKRAMGDTDDPTSAFIDKTKVLQDAKECFRAASGKTSKLVDVLTRCIYLMLQGEKLTNTEATNLFLHITFLFQYKSKDNTLRRLIYIAIKALSHQADQLFAATASLTADVNNQAYDPTVRISALRALCQIADASTTSESIESLLRQSVVDKHPVVASAALTSLIHIAKHNGKIVERCTNEIQEALKSDSPVVQYHALALRYMACKNNRLATSRLLEMCIDHRPNSPLAICLLLRILASYINDDSSLTSDNVKLYIGYIFDCLSHRSEMVEYEAACQLLAVARRDPSLYKREEMSALSHLRNLLTAPRAALRFSALRLLNDHGASSLDNRCWSIQRIGNLCKLHLLTKRYKPGDEIIGMLDFTARSGQQQTTASQIACARYICTLQCESAQVFEVRQEFSLGYTQSEFALTIPELDSDALHEALDEQANLHCVLSFLFYITDRGHQEPRTLIEDGAGTIAQAPAEIETKQFSCDFPILINTAVQGRSSRGPGDTCVAGANVGAVDEQVH